jgi:hypothetical protein
MNQLYDEFEEAVRVLVTKLDNDLDYEPALVVVVRYMALLEVQRIDKGWRDKVAKHTRKKT